MIKHLFQKQMQSCVVIKSDSGLHRSPPFLDKTRDFVVFTRSNPEKVSFDSFSCVELFFLSQWENFSSCWLLCVLGCQTRCQTNWHYSWYSRSAAANVEPRHRHKNTMLCCNRFILFFPTHSFVVIGANLSCLWSRPQSMHSMFNVTTQLYNHLVIFNCFKRITWLQ